jgi:hypothetical protein
MQSFNDYYILGWSKDPQWENECNSFLPCFLLVETNPDMNQPKKCLNPNYVTTPIV